LVIPDLTLIMGRVNRVGSRNDVCGDLGSRQGVFGLRGSAAFNGASD